MSRHEFDPNESDLVEAAKFALGVVVVAGIVIAISTIALMF